MDGSFDEIDQEPAASMVMRVALVLVLAVAGWGCAASEDTPGAVDSAISAPDSAGKPPTNGIVALDPAQHLIRAAMVRHTTVTG